MSQITWTETELEKGSGAFLKAACSLPGRIINVNNGVASVSGMNYSTESTLFQKLINTGCIKSIGSGYEVTEFWALLADK